MGSRSFPGVKRAELGFNYVPPSSTGVKEQWSYPPLPLCAFMLCYGVN